MQLDDIIKRLQKLLDTKKGLDSKRIDAVLQLVARLEKKEAKYTHKLAGAQGEKEKKKIKRHLKVCRAQLEKGRAALDDLRKYAE